MMTTTISGDLVVVSQNRIFTSWKFAPANHTRRTKATPVKTIRVSRPRFRGGGPSEGGCAPGAVH